MDSTELSDLIEELEQILADRAWWLALATEGPSGQIDLRERNSKMRDVLGMSRAQLERMIEVELADPRLAQAQSACLRGWRQAKKEAAERARELREHTEKDGSYTGYLEKRRLAHGALAHAHAWSRILGQSEAPSENEEFTRENRWFTARQGTAEGWEKAARELLTEAGVREEEVGEALKKRVMVARANDWHPLGWFFKTKHPYLTTIPAAAVHLEPWCYAEYIHLEGVSDKEEETLLALYGTDAYPDLRSALAAAQALESQ